MAGKRKAGEGTVRERSDGRWEGRIVTHYDEKGLPKTKSVFGKTKRECERKLDELKEKLSSTSVKIRIHSSVVLLTICNMAWASVGWVYSLLYSSL